MRLFTGIALAPAVAKRIDAALEDLRPTARLNWTPSENLHITCRFIGTWHEEGLNELKTALNITAHTGPIAIRIAQFGFFPNPDHPHSFFADVHAPPALAALATAIDHALLPLGVAPESRPYRPHVTLARIKGNADIRGLREHVATMTDFDFGSFDAHEFHLCESTPSARGSVYKKLATYDLMREKKEN